MGRRSTRKNQPRRRNQRRSGHVFTNTFIKDIAVNTSGAAEDFDLGKLLDLDGREVIVNSVGVQLMPPRSFTDLSTTEKQVVPTFAQLRWTGPLGDAQGDGMANSPPKMLSYTNPTNLLIRAKLPYQKRPLDSQASDSLLRIDFQSVDRADFKVLAIITTKVTLLPQTNLTIN